ERLAGPAILVELGDFPIFASIPAKIWGTGARQAGFDVREVMDAAADQEIHETLVAVDYAPAVRGVLRKHGRGDSGIAVAESAPVADYCFGPAIVVEVAEQGNLGF